MDGTLFVADQDVADILPEELVIDIHDASPRISEEGIDVFFFQGPKEDLRSGLLHGSFPPGCFPKIKKPLPEEVTAFVQSNFKNRPSPSPYVEGNNNPANYRDPYEADADSDLFHDYPSQK
jgi:hypothetical protein